MLQRLLIKDFVIVESLELEFSAGFSAFTGETGAGKSILLDALGLALGGRLSGNPVRASAQRAEVAAEFLVERNRPAQAWLTAGDYQPDAGEPVLLRRVIDANGRSKAYVNGRAATANDLRTLADLLINVHGQHDNMRLATGDTQRDAIDKFAKAGDAAKTVADCYSALREAQSQLKQALEGREQADIQRELIDRQLTEIKETGFTAATWVQELQDHTRLSHSQELMGAAQSALAQLSGEGSEASEDGASRSRGRVATDILSQVHTVQRLLSEAARHDEQLNALAKALDACSIAASEVAHDLSRYVDKLELDPAAFEALDSKVGKVHSLARKLRIPPTDLASHAQSLIAKREALPSSERIESLEHAVNDAIKVYDKAAVTLTQLRKPACKTIAERVLTRLQQLAMPNSKFEVRMNALDEPSVHGAETIEFVVSMNPGMPLASMSQVASGGELSRIGLALQVELGAAVGLPVMVFDEVDTGVSGRVAQTVGELLRSIASNSANADTQVLAVTHLPQVAASAHTQYRVSKMSTGNTTATRVDRLSEESRVEELARMLSGAEVTSEARAAALALVSQTTGADTTPAKKRKGNVE